MPARIDLRRKDTSTPWGFRIQGGSDYGQPLIIASVQPNGLAFQGGLRQGDEVVNIGGDSSLSMTHQQAQQAIIRCGNELCIYVQKFRQLSSNFVVNNSFQKEYPDQYSGEDDAYYPAYAGSLHPTGKLGNHATNYSSNSYSAAIVMPSHQNYPQQRHNPSGSWYSGGSLPCGSTIITSPNTRPNQSTMRSQITLNMRPGISSLQYPEQPAKVYAANPPWSNDNQTPHTRTIKAPMRSVNTSAPNRFGPHATLSSTNASHGSSSGGVPAASKPANWGMNNRMLPSNRNAGTDYYGTSDQSAPTRQNTKLVPQAAQPNYASVPFKPIPSSGHAPYNAANARPVKQADMPKTFTKLNQMPASSHSGISKEIGMPALANDHTSSRPTALKVRTGAGTDILTKPESTSSDKPVCYTCKSQIRGPYLAVMEYCFCPDHFTCTHCQQHITNTSFVERDGKFYCHADFRTYVASRCAKCHEPVVETVVIALDQHWHTSCFVCNHCRKPINDSLFRIGDDDGEIYCETHWKQLFQVICEKCGKPVQEIDRFLEIGGKKIHAECFVCAACQCPLEGKPFRSRDGKAFCKMHANAVAVFG